MDQQKNYVNLRYDKMEARNEGLGFGFQNQDPSASIGTNLRPPDHNMSVRARPVLNYSIQTGEEFAFEFMQHRVNPQHHFLPSAYGDPNSVTGYTDLRGIIGRPPAGSESGSDISILRAVERPPAQDFEMKASSSAYEDQSYFGSASSVPQISSQNDIGQVFHSSIGSEAPDAPIVKVKFLCSFGGTILPRPSDGKLRYVGGHTRIIRIRKNISWQELRQKVLAIYDQGHVIKYQLPGEDLDALVSVSSEEDLRNMMEECSAQEGEETFRPRMFLFSDDDLEDAQFGVGSMGVDSEIQYVVAVNGMDLGSRRNSVGFASASQTNLDELLSLNAQRENTGGATELTESGVLPPIVNVASSTSQSSPPVPPNSSIAHESTFPTYQAQQMRHGDSNKHLVSAMQPAETFPMADLKITKPLPVPLQQGFGSHPSQHSKNGDRLGTIPSHAVPTHNWGVIEEPGRGGLHVQNAEISMKDAKLKRDSSGQKLNEQEKIQPLDKEAPMKELKIKRDGSRQTINESVKVRMGENEKVVSMQPPDGPIPNSISGEELSINDSAADLESSLLPQRSSRKLQEPLQNPTTPDAANEVTNKNGGDELFSSGGPFISGYAGSEGNIPEYGYPEPSSVPQRVFHSEWLPREQAELNRLSKSNDSFDPQVLLTQALSGQSQTIAESVNKVNGSSVTSKVEDRTKDRRPQFQKYEEIEEDISKLNSSTSPGLKSNLEKSASTHEEAPKPIDNRVVNQEKGNNKELEIVDKGVANRKNSDMTDGLVQPHALTKNTVGAVSQGKSIIDDSKQGDIIIDINDRFPPEFLSDISLQVKMHENVASTTPVHVDETGLSLKMENHEPKRWSYFRNLAQDQFVRKDFSLMDQDHPSFPAAMANVGGVPIDYSYPPLSSNITAMPQSDSHTNFVDDVQQGKAIVIEPSAMDSHFQVKETAELDVVSTRIPDSEYEDSKLDLQETGASLLNSSLGDIDIQTLQIIKNEDLEELRELGSGTFGTVYHGKWRGSDVAIKRIKKTCFTGRSSQQEKLELEFWREAEMMSKLHHPNVVAFYGVVKDGPGGTLATVTEFMVNGSLRHVLLSKDRQFDPRKRLIIAMDAAFGMEYLHSKNIVHFDLKCDNLLVNLKDPSRPICKVGDFGLSKMKRNTLVTGGVRGTLPWMAPELLNGGSNKVSEKVDVFSFGIVMWEILTSEEPYANMHYGAIIGGIVNNTLRPNVPSNCDPDWKLLMEQCWAPDPSFRPSFTEIARRLRAMSAAASQPKQHIHQPHSQNQVINK